MLQEEKAKRMNFFKIFFIRFSEDGSCETGNISRIIDVPAGNISLEIFVADGVLSTLPRLCLGGEGCCQVTIFTFRIKKRIWKNICRNKLRLMSNLSKLFSIIITLDEGLLRRTRQFCEPNMELNIFAFLILVRKMKM